MRIYSSIWGVKKFVEHVSQTEHKTRMVLFVDYFGFLLGLEYMWYFNPCPSDLQENDDLFNNSCMLKRDRRENRCKDAPKQRYNRMDKKEEKEHQSVYIAHES